MKRKIFCIILTLLIGFAGLSQTQTATPDSSEENFYHYNLSCPPLLGGDLIYRSVLSHFKYGWPAGAASFPLMFVADLKVHKTKRVVMINLPISALYIYAAYNLFVPRQNTTSVILEVKDTFRYCYPQLYPQHAPKMDDSSYLEWKIRNYFCYELIASDTVNDALFDEMMLQDLNRCFSVKGVIEKRTRICYVLTNVTKGSKHLGTVKTKPDIPNLLPNSSAIGRGFEDLTIDQILAWLTQINWSYPIINETSNTNPIDIYFNFNTDGLNIAEVKAGFEKYGFKLKKTQRKILTLVLKDK